MLGIVDYGMGNIQSVINAFDFIGQEVVVVSAPQELMRCKGLVLPGVGAFGEAMKNLESNKLVGPLRHLVLEKGRPILGICLGLQLLAESSEEFGLHKGLAMIPGHVRKISEIKQYRLPHIGWNEVKISQLNKSNLLNGIDEKASFYFVHSYMIDCDEKYVLGSTFHGSLIPSIIQKNNVYATQFHPEKSQSNGLQLIRNFSDIVNGANLAGSDA
jgi:glutamine amidotransferase